MESKEDKDIDTFLEDCKLIELDLYHRGKKTLKCPEGNNDYKKANSSTEFQKNSETGMPVIQRYYF